MYGIYKNKVAINNVNPNFGDGQLKLDDSDWGWGVNLGLLYEITTLIKQIERTFVANSGG
jgi:long-subunit fatty acid transport protein